MAGAEETMPSPIRQMVAKWLLQADHIQEHICGLGWSHGVRFALRGCADDLAAVLDALPQAEKACEQQMTIVPIEDDNSAHVIFQSRVEPSFHCVEGTGSIVSIHHALASKFTEDFTSEGGLCEVSLAESYVRLKEESNNPAREWWDSVYGAPASSLASPEIEKIEHCTVKDCDSGFARCPECGNLAMNPLPGCRTCGNG